jgi:hypothetical protein
MSRDFFKQFSENLDFERRFQHFFIRPFKHLVYLSTELLFSVCVGKYNTLQGA